MSSTSGCRCPPPRGADVLHLGMPIYIILILTYYIILLLYILLYYIILYYIIIYYYIISYCIILILYYTTLLYYIKILYYIILLFFWPPLRTPPSPSRGGNLAEAGLPGRVAWPGCRAGSPGRRVAGSPGCRVAGPCCLVAGLPGRRVGGPGRRNIRNILYCIILYCIT